MEKASLRDQALAFLADTVDDIEGIRKATANRLRIMTATEPDEDGVLRGFGYPETHPAVASLAQFLELVVAAEKAAVKNLERQLRKHPLYPWVLQHRGVGAKQAARLLASIGDPYIRPEWIRTDETVVPEGPRTVSALWAYMGLHVSAGAAPKRTKGVQSNWSEVARMRVWNVARSVVKSGIDTSTCVGVGNSETGEAIHKDGCGCGSYRLLYDAGRAKYADATHPAPCVRCGPKGNPAEAGSPLSPGHREARALRLVMKAIVKDLWREAKAYHEPPDA